MAPLKHPRRENFCLAFVAGVDRAEAYKRAYRCKDITTAVRNNACRLLNRKDVQERIDELQDGVAKVVVEQTGLNDTRVVEELAKIAFAEFDPKSITVKDKLGALKILEERTRGMRSEEEQEGKRSSFIDAPPRETWEQWLEREELDGHGARALAAPKRPTNGRVPSDVD